MTYFTNSTTLTDVGDTKLKFMQRCNVMDNFTRKVYRKYGGRKLKHRIRKQHVTAPLSPNCRLKTGVITSDCQIDVIVDVIIGPYLTECSPAET